MVIRRNGPFNDMALDDMGLDEVSGSRLAIIGPLAKGHLNGVSLAAR